MDQHSRVLVLNDIKEIRRCLPDAETVSYDDWRTAGPDGSTIQIDKWKIHVALDLLSKLESKIKPPCYEDDELKSMIYSTSESDMEFINSRSDLVNLCEAIGRGQQVG